MRSTGPRGDIESAANLRRIISPRLNFEELAAVQLVFTAPTPDSGLQIERARAPIQVFFLPTRKAASDVEGLDLH